MNRFFHCISFRHQTLFSTNPSAGKYREQQNPVSNDNQALIVLTVLVNQQCKLQTHNIIRTSSCTFYVKNTFSFYDSLVRSIELYIWPSSGCYNRSVNMWVSTLLKCKWLRIHYNKNWCDLYFAANGYFKITFPCLYRCLPCALPHAV